MRKLSIIVTKEFNLTDAEYDLVYSLYTCEYPRKVAAVKFIKTQYNMSLKEAKDLCDLIGNNEYLQSTKGV